MKTLPPYNRPNQVGCAAALLVLTLNNIVTKHTNKEEDTEIHPLTFFRRHASFRHPQKFGSVLLLIQRLIFHIRPLQSVQTAHTAHNMHMNTDINT